MFEGPQLSIIQVLHVCIQEPNLVFTLPAYVLVLTSDDYTIIIIILKVSLSIKDFGYGFVDPITSSKMKSCGISNANELEYVYADLSIMICHILYLFAITKEMQHIAPCSTQHTFHRNNIHQI